MAFRILSSFTRGLSDRAKAGFSWIGGAIWKFAEWYADKEVGDTAFAWLRDGLGVSPGSDIWNAFWGWGPPVLLFCVGLYFVLRSSKPSAPVSLEPPVPAQSAGGSGGSVTIKNTGVAVGLAGGGGRAGPGAAGGKGGDVDISGAIWGLGVGGEAGDAVRADGSGGRGGRSPLEVLAEHAPGLLNLPGGNIRLVLLLGQLRQEYAASHPEAAESIAAGSEQPPDAWVNARLAALGEPWRVAATGSGYEFRHTGGREHGS